MEVVERMKNLIKTYYVRLKNPYSIEEKYLNPFDKILMYLSSIPQSPKLIRSSGIHSALTTLVIVNTIEFLSH